MRRYGWLLSVCACALLLTACGTERTPDAKSDERSDLPPVVVIQNAEEPAPAEARTPGSRAITLIIGGESFSATLADNETAAAFAELLPLTLDLSELNGNEKYHYLDDNLPSAAQAVGEIEAGDLMLYGSNCVVLFYDSFSTPYRYTRIGRLDDTAGLREAVGSDGVTVAFDRG